MLTQFIWSEIDYLFFFKSITMMLLAATAGALMLRKMLHLPWGLLLISCSLGWVSIWVDLFVYANGDTVWLTLAYTGFRIGAGLFLFEFTRGCIHRLGTWRIGPWVYGVWAVLGVGSLWVSHLGPMVALVLLLSASGAGVVWIMFRLSREVSTARWILKAGGVTMLLYVLSIIPSGLVDPWRNVSVETVSQLPRQFLIFMQGVFLLVTALGMWRLFWNAQDEVGDLKQTEANRIQGWLIPLLCLVFGLNWVTMVSYSRREAKMLKENILLEIRNLALGIKSEQIALLTGTPEDNARPEFQTLKMTLKSLCNPSQFHSIFILGNRRYGPDMLVDSRFSEAENGSYILTEIMPPLQGLFKQPQDALWGPVRDETGHWMLVLSPIFDPESNALVGFMGAKKDFREWQKKIAQSRLLPMGLVSILSFMLIAFFIVTRWFMENKHLVELSEARYRNLASKSAFLANVSHEIRTPLNAILGFSQWILRDTRLPGEHRKHLETIQRSGEHLLGLINNLLEMSRLEMGRIRVQNSEFDVRRLARDLAELFKIRTSDKQITFRVELGESIPTAIVADEGKLRQIFINLLANAIKFTERGEVTWKLEYLLPSTGNTGRLMAYVQDTGPGIADADQKRIFEAFEQTPTGMHAGGTGLGLSICREFVQLLGGEIKVSSVLGSGSCFRIWVPVQVVEQVAAAEAPACFPIAGLSPGARAVRVLVADDQAENRELLRVILERVGFVVREAGSGSEVLALSAEWSPDAILLDLHMPGLSGREVIQSLAAKAPGMLPRIVVVTGSEHVSGQEGAKALGADAVVEKPVREQALLEVLGTVLGVAYTYAQAPVPETASTYSRLLLDTFFRTHPDWLEEVRYAVEHADYYRILELLDNPELNAAGLGDRLRKQAERFEYQALLALLPAREGTHV